MVISGVVFDIDDTLYLEADYVRSGFQHVAQVAGRSSLEADELATWLWAAFEAGIRRDTFDRLLAAFPAVAERVSVAELITAYRRHQPDISLSPGVAPILTTIRDLGLRVGVLSDGPATSQAAKVAALELTRWARPILLTGALGPEFAKPGTRGFERIARSWGLPAPSLAYVADNPEKDFVGPRKLGWLAIRLRMPGQLHFGDEAAGESARADLEIDSLGALVAALRDAGPRPTPWVGPSAG